MVIPRTTSPTLNSFLERNMIPPVSRLRRHDCEGRAVQHAFPASPELRLESGNGHDTSDRLRIQWRNRADAAAAPVILFSSGRYLRRCYFDHETRSCIGFARRAEILRNAGFSFEVSAADVDEIPGRTSLRRFTCGGLRKRRHALRSSDSRTTKPGDRDCRGYDRRCRGQMLGKPESREDARRMLRLLSGQTHEVLTGISVIRSSDGYAASHVEITRVSFAELSESEIEDISLRRTV